jgi:hypothetical protein
MKKIFYITTLLLIFVGLELKATKPIPSYDVPIRNGANFQEKEEGGKGHDGTGTIGNDIKNKRDLDVRSTVPPGHMPVITVWVYSLDGHDVLGPFTMYGNDFLVVSVDDREWGVAVQCVDKVYVSVWFSAATAQNDAGASPYQLQPGTNSAMLSLATPVEENQAILSRNSYFFNRS